MQKSYSHRVTLLASAAVAAISASPPTYAQTAPTRPTTQSEQPSLQDEAQRLEQVQQQLSKSQPGSDMQAKMQQAEQSLKVLRTNLEQMKINRGQQPAPQIDLVYQSVADAQAEMLRKAPAPEVAQALQKVVQNARTFTQQMAQAGGAQAPQPGQATAPADKTQVQVQQKSAEVDVKQPAPQVQIEQPQPKVTIKQPPPQVSVEQAKPDVKVEAAEPQVEVRQSGQPQVMVEKEGQPQVSVENQGQPQVKAEQQPAEANAKTAQMTPPPRPENTVAMMGRDLVGKVLYGNGGDRIGDIEDVVMKGDNAESVLVDVGGFLGIGAKRVALPTDQITSRDNQLTIGMTEDQVRNLPEYPAGKQN